MAIEDAVVLAQCIRNAVNCKGVFEAFMARRFGRIKTVVESSLALSKLGQTGAPPSERMKMLRKAWEAISDPY